MFRFTIRDLLWLTLVVALGAGWFVRERHLRLELDPKTWRGRAGALEYALKEHGCTVEWQSSAVVVVWPAEYPTAFVYRHGVYDCREPSGPTSDE